MRKKSVIALTAISLAHVHAIHAQSLPDPDPTPASNSNYYYENRGQIIDEDGGIYPEIKFYTEKTFPRMFLADDKISYVAYQQADTSLPNPRDSAARIDLRFLCSPPSKSTEESQEVFCGTLRPFEQSGDYLNYYLPHCPSGIEDVAGFARVVYENAFPNIDVHFYSNSYAVKNYIVIRPGGDPNDILLKFEGQDSINVLTSGALSMYLSNWKMTFPQAIAYQVDASNNIIPVSWLPTWNHQGSGLVNVLVGTYNTSETLVIAIGGIGEKPTGIKNLEWSTYYGAAGTQHIATITANQNDEAYHVMVENSGYFPKFLGQFDYNPGGWDMYITKFNNIAGRKWATYYGGSGAESPFAIEEAHPGTTDGDLWVGGSTNSTDVPLGPVTGSFKQTTNWNEEGLLSSFNKANGYLKYATYFGSKGTGNPQHLVGGYDQIFDISIDNIDDLVYICGRTDTEGPASASCATPASGIFPLCPGTGRYFMMGNNGGFTGFIAEIGIANKTLNWSTYFGGKSNYNHQSTNVSTILKVHDNYENSLYVGGGTEIATGHVSIYNTPVTSSPLDHFPIVDLQNGEFVQSSIGPDAYGESSQVFLSKFDEDFKLVWSTFLGYMGDFERSFGSLAMNSEHQLFATASNAGGVAPLSPYPNTSGLTPSWTDGAGYLDNTMNTWSNICKFSPGKSLMWSTKHRAKSAKLVVGDQDKVYVVGFTDDNNLPMWQASTGYWLSQNSFYTSGFPGTYAGDRSEGHIAAFNKNGTPLWGTYFGGSPTPQNATQDATPLDRIEGLAVTPNGKLFVTGTTSCPFSPYNQDPGGGAYFDGTYNTGRDAFISRFDVSGINPNEGPLGINQNNATESGSVLIFPNPSPNVFNVSFNNTGNASVADITLRDQTGRLIRSTTFKISKGENQFEINLEGFSAAMYYLEIKSDDIKKAGKLVKINK